MSDKEQHILHWIKEVSKIRPELNGFAICLFAAKSKYKIIECSVKNLFIDDEYEVLIFIVEDELSLDDINKWVGHYNSLFPTWKFFEDCGSYDTFINGVQTNNGLYNLILGQPYKKLRRFREQLSKTGYYDLWNEDYLNEILENDLNIIGD